MEENELPSEKTEKRTLKLDMDESTSHGIYSNLCLTNFTKEEFILDFSFVQPNLNKGKIRSRIILSPENAKRLANNLLKNVNEFESKYQSNDDGVPPSGINLSFN